MTEAAVDTATTEHVVARGDTLTSIGRRYGVRVADIKSENGLTADTIRIGQRLRIPR